eukprot:gb/GECG01009207.1/.p1 GENE.gb/GECG01009207.1/~~gb/GECG01009207.1/.p1  ORF type:complete len:599 (+),score=53.80 gb/GECG01009207.1/:1-1797(+)
MSLIKDDRFKPKIYKDFPNVVKPVEPQFRFTSSVRNYNAFDVDPTSNSKRGLQFEVSATSYDTVIRRDLRLSTYYIHRIRVKPVGGALPGGTTILTPNSIGLRDHPLNRLWESPRLKINNETISVDLSRQFQSQNLAMYDEDNANKYHTPNNIDIGIQSYNDAGQSNATPLQSYNGMTLQSQHVPDGSFVPYSFTDANGNNLKNGDSYNSSPNNTTIDATGNGRNGFATEISPNSDVSAGTEFDIYVKYYLEAVPWISPLLYDGENGMNHEGMWGIKQMRLNLDTVNDPKIVRNCSEDPAGIIAGNANSARLEVTEEDYGGQNSPFVDPQIHYLSMEQPYTLPSQLPKVNTLPYYQFDSYPKTVSASWKNNRIQVRSDNIQLGTIPDKMILSVRPRREDLSPRDADFHYVPESISIRLGNSTGILQTLSQSDIYDMTRQYIPVPFDTFLGEGVSHEGLRIPLTSAPIVMDFGHDVPLETGLTTGVSVKTNLEITADVYDQTGANNSNVEIEVIMIDSAFLYNSNGASETFSGFLTESDVYNAQVWPEQHSPEQKIGGKKRSLLGQLGHGVSKIGTQVGKKALDKAVDKGSDAVVSKLK